MKKNLRIQKLRRSLIGTGALVAGACLAATPSASAQQTNAPAAKADDTSKTAAAAPSDVDTSDLVNWVEVGVGDNFVSGNKAQAEKMLGTPANQPFGGVEAFHYEQTLDKKGLFSVDGRGIFDNHDYDLKLEVSHPDIGYVRAGVDQFRKYYNGDGGFFPTTGFSYKLAEDRDAVDRGDYYIEAGLTLPDLPVFKVRYDHQFRDGEKDSTEWGTYYYSAAGQAKVYPSFYNLNEKLDILSADITHTIGNTDFGVGARYQIEHNDDSQTYYYQPAAVSPPSTPASQTQNNTISANMFDVHAFTDTQLNKKLEFTTGYSFSTLHSGVEGNSLTGIPETQLASQFVGLSGGSDMDQYEMNLNLMWSPIENLYVVPSVLVNKENVSGTSLYYPVTFTAGKDVVSTTPTLGYSDEYDLGVAQGLSVRYTGITNWVFYVQGDWAQDRADLDMTSAPLNGAQTGAIQEWDHSYQKYTVGANWYPYRNLNFAAQYYHKIDDNDYDNNFPGSITNYPGFIKYQAFNLDDANFRVTWRPCSRVTTVTRYDFQYETVDTQGSDSTSFVPLAEQQSGLMKAHMIGETLSWTPLDRFYTQVGFNYVVDTWDTPVEGLPSIGNAVQQSKNDYWTVNALAGFALDAKTDLRASYTYYRAGDYSNISPPSTAIANGLGYGVPYGSGSEETTVSATLTRKITERMRWSLTYDFAAYRDQLFGSQSEFNAHSILSTLQYRF
jgi:hypothetical protein